MLLSDAAPFFYDHVQMIVVNLKGRCLAAQTRRDQLDGETVVFNVKNAGLEEQLEDLFLGHAQRAKQHCGRQFAAAVNADKHVVTRIELKVKP